MNRSIFFAKLRQTIFRGRLTQAQVDGTTAIIDHWLEHHRDAPDAFLAYILATAWHETAHTMQPVRESLGKTDAQVVARLDAAHRKGLIKKRYWELDPTTRKRFYGRGYVQITFKENYAKAGRKLAIPELETDPDLALVPDIAASILCRGMVEGWFTGKRLSDYITENATDYRGARRVVNGTDKASLIAGYATVFEEAIEASKVAAANRLTEEPIEPSGKTASQSTTVRAAAAQGVIAVGAAAAAAESISPWLALAAGVAAGGLATYIILERMRHSQEEGI